jgi:hypothetical protein
MPYERVDGTAGDRPIAWWGVGEAPRIDRGRPSYHDAPVNWLILNYFVCSTHTLVGHFPNTQGTGGMFHVEHSLPLRHEPKCSTWNIRSARLLG